MLLTQWGPLPGPLPWAGAFEPFASFAAFGPPNSTFWRDTPDALTLELRTPGYRRRDLTVEVDGRVLRVRGERREGWFRPRCQVFEERIALPETADPGIVEANFHRGTLWVRLAKRPEARQHVIPIKVRGSYVEAEGTEVIAPPAPWPRRGLDRLARGWQRLRDGLSQALRGATDRARALPPARSLLGTCGIRPRVASRLRVSRSERHRHAARIASRFRVSRLGRTGTRLASPRPSRSACVAGPGGPLASGGRQCPRWHGSCSRPPDDALPSAARRSVDATSEEVPTMQNRRNERDWREPQAREPQGWHPAGDYARGGYQGGYPESVYQGGRQGGGQGSGFQGGRVQHTYDRDPDLDWHGGGQPGNVGGYGQQGWQGGQRGYGQQGWQGGEQRGYGQQGWQGGEQRGYGQQGWQGGQRSYGGQGEQGGYGRQGWQGEQSSYGPGGHFGGYGQPGNVGGYGQPSHVGGYGQQGWQGEPGGYGRQDNVGGYGRSGGYGNESRFGGQGWSGQSSAVYGQGMGPSSQGQGARQSHRGRGPRGYQRSDERIREEVCDCLTDHHEIDASEIHVEVKDGEVTLTGTVDERRVKFLAEQIAESVGGVQEIHNQLRIRREGMRQERSGGAQASALGRGAGAATSPTHEHGDASRRVSLESRAQRPPGKAIF